jgi:ribonuclease D
VQFKNTYTSISHIPMRQDAGELREHLTHELYQWQLEGSRSPDWVKSFWVKVKHLARMVGKTPEEVHDDLQEDVDNMGSEEEDVDLNHMRDRSAKQKFTKESPFKICNSQGLKPHSEKWRSCVEDLKKEHGIPMSSK